MLKEMSPRVYLGIDWEDELSRHHGSGTRRVYSGLRGNQSGSRNYKYKPMLEFANSPSVKSVLKPSLSLFVEDVLFDIVLP